MGQTSTSLDNTSLDPECIGRRYWYVFLMSSLITFFGGLLIIFFWRFMTFLLYGQFFKKIRKRVFKFKNIDQINLLEHSDPEIGWVTTARDFCGELISGQSTSGRILMTLVSILSVGSLVIYFFDASTSPIETCQKWKESISQQIDLGFNLFFMLYFFIRFVAAQDKLWFWLDIFSIVDYFTIPPSFVSIYLDRNWIGLRFLRVLRLMNIPDILQYLNILKTSNSIRLTQLFVMFISIWLSAAGFVHLVENSDFPIEFFTSNNVTNITNHSPELTFDSHHSHLNHKSLNKASGLSYFDSIYFIVVTMSTVGYGDIYCRTTLGKLSVVLFLFCGIAVFASAIPELAQIIGNRPKFAGSYKLEKGKRHVFVCGHITYTTVANFLKEFLHKDLLGVVNIIFLGENQQLDIKLNKLNYIIQNFFDFYLAKIAPVLNDDDFDLNHNLQNHKCLFLDHLNTRSKLAEQFLHSDYHALNKIFNSCKTNKTFQKVIKLNRTIIKIDLNLLSRITGIKVGFIKCHVYKFDKKYDESEEDQETEIEKIYKFDTDEVTVDTHGYYYLICQNSDRLYSKVFDQVLTVYPSDMSQLTRDRKKFFTLKENKNDQTENKMNVLILGIDSVSSNHFRRIFPQTFNYLKQLEDNLIFDHFNSLGQNTYPNVLAMLSGIVEEDLSDSLKGEIEKYRQIDSTYHDHLPFIWNDYENSGYVTMFQEDDPEIAIFNYLKKGFRYWPTGMYGRPFWTKYYETRSGPDKCHFNYPTYMTWFDFIKNFLQSVQTSQNKSPFFSFNFLTEYTHNYFAIPKKLDEDLKDFISNLDLENTLLIIFSDHGNRLKFYSYATEMGKLEKHLPFLSIRVPKKMTRTKYYNNLKLNTNKLISFFDLYQTLRHYLYLNKHGSSTGLENEFKNNSKFDRVRRGVSLFEVIPVNRSCEEACIPVDLCPCLTQVNLTESEFLKETRVNFKRVNELVLKHVNEKTDIIRPDCQAYEFKRLVQIKKVFVNKKVIYRVIYILEPGNSCVLPDLDLEALFKKNFTQVKFLQGSVMNPKDLERAKIKKADAVLILANKESISPDNEDEANIMRVISIKNFHPNVKIIIQLLQYHNKMYLLNIPSWDWKQGDEAVCIAELKLGLMAQSCLAPGFSSLMANLFAMRSYKEVFAAGANILYKKHTEDPWLAHYLRGSSMEMYTEYLSPAFTGKTFTEAAIICYTKLKLLLLAVESSNESGYGSHLSINPGNTVRVESGTRGFFIAGSFEEIKRAYYYCELCHKDVVDLNKIKQCKCHQARNLFSKTVHRMRKKSAINEENLNSNFKKEESLSDIQFSDKNLENYDKLSHIDERFDSTGMFHWIEEQSFADCLLDSNLKHSSFIGHVIVCVFAEANSPLIGLLFIGNKDFLYKEWKSISNFPKVYVLPGSPNSRSLLRSVNIQFCDMTVVISSIERDSQDENLFDKSAILCSLNIKAMNFDDSAGLIGESNQIFSPRMSPKNQQAQNWKTLVGTHIPMLTELRVDSNVQFLDQDDEDDPTEELYMSQPFACGTAFAISVLDCIMSTAYFNDNALTLIRTLITGGTTPELEQILAEGANIAPGFNKDNFENRNRPRVSQISLFDGEFAKYGENRLYSELFVYCLTKHNMLCWGVYRFRDAFNGSQKVLSPSNKRYVICNPSADFKLIPTDLIYVLEQFNPNMPFNKTNDSFIKNTSKQELNSKSSIYNECNLRGSRSSSKNKQRKRDSQVSLDKQRETSDEIKSKKDNYRERFKINKSKSDYLLSLNNNNNNNNEINESTF
ncbi:unnamed protein product [Brachionus calyciflorus]|uniref:BK channel n=1 Tax=Brachionus calyciflorus TaxID=104777 RepID=A0A813UM42_9BILA|nr:unnamed protein product [Brachionus calyciflorus]